MEHTHTSLVRRLMTIALLAGGIAHADDSVTPHTRDASGIASAVTEVLPAIGDCLESDRAIGGPDELSVMIAFDVIENGEIGSLVINGLHARVGQSPLPACLEGTIAALRFAPGTKAIPVQLPLEARAADETATY